ncbi:MAG: endonuclease/exonuclease/phosphatase family protein [Chitinophagales bacterium]|nr:endonuclease/exonuclease/phosphatase family protein [Chitinophagales bacterium]
MLIILFLSFFFHEGKAQKRGTYRVVTYNLENLFDTVLQPGGKDSNFTPSGKFQWNSLRYQTKLSNLSKVITSVCDTFPLLFLAINEVENKNVIRDWLKQPAMKKFNLSYIHFDSVDPRGMDVALLYNKKIFRPKHKSVIQPYFDFDSAYKARGILYVAGKFGKQKLHVFVNHWSSRSGGAVKSEPRRIATAQLLKKKLDEIRKQEADPKILLLGDFNDPPHAPSLTDYLGVKRHLLALKKNDLFNLMADASEKGGFTFDYQGEQDMLDQIIVSENFVRSSCQLCIYKNSGYVFQPKWLFYKSSKYGVIPFRTFEGEKYVGGFSDHLPVYCDVVVK